MNVWSQPNSVDILMPAKKTNLLFLTSLRSLCQYRDFPEDLFIFQVMYRKRFVVLRIVFDKMKDTLNATTTKKNAMKINFQYIMFDYIFPFFKKNQQYWCLVVVSIRNAISYDTSILIKVGWYICWDETQPRKKETLLKESKDQGSWRQL